MGKRIKSTGIILDASSMASAPVSPAGTVALRAKPDATQPQYSANGGAWTDFGGSSTGTVRLDQVENPDIPPEVPPVNRVKTFSMTDHSLVFGFTATQSEECFVIVSTEPVTPGAAGALLLLRAAGATTEKSPLRIETRGTFALSVTPTGRVLLGAETDLGDRLNVYQINTGAENTGVFHASCNLITGSTTTSMQASMIQLSDGGSSAGLLSMKTMELALHRNGDALDNLSLNTTTLTLDMNMIASTNRVRGIYMSLSCLGTLTINEWEGIRIGGVSIIGGSVVTTRRAIVTEAGAGNVGFGLSAPAAQLHVDGTVQIDQALTQFVNIYKYSDTDEHPALVFNRAKGIPGSAADVTSGHGVGALSFRGRLSGVFTQLGYVRCFYDSTDIGVTELGSGAVDLARVKVTQSASAGSASLIASPYSVEVRTGGVVFSHGTTGSIYYKAATGYVVSLDILTSPSDEGKVLTVTNVSGALLPRWAASTGTASAAGSFSELQHRNSTTGAFAAVSGSRVSGSQVWLTGTAGFAIGIADTVGSLDDRNFRSERSQAITSGLGYNVQLLTTLTNSSSSSAIINGIDNRVVISSTAANSGSVYGLYSQVTLSAAQSMTSLVGVRGRVNTTTSGANIQTLMGGYFSADRGSSGTTTISRAIYATLSSSLGTTTNGYGLDVFIDNPSGSIGVAYGVNIYSEESGGTLGTVYGLYINSSGTFGANYGVVVTSNVTASGFGISSPSATLHVVGTVRLDLGGDATGDIYYRSATSGPLARLGVGTNGHVLTLAAGLPSWAAATGGTPGGSTYDVQYKTATPSFGGITQVQYGILMCSSAAPPFFTGTLGPIRYTYSPTSTVAGLNMGSLGSVGTGNPSSPVNGDIYYNSSAGKIRAYQNGVWIEPGTAAGTGSEVQYRNSSTGAFAAVLASSVDGSGVVTFGSGRTTWVGDGSVANLELNHYSNVASFGTFLTATRSRGSSGSKLTLAAGDALFELSIFGQYDASNRRYCGALSFDTQGIFSATSAPTILKMKTTHINSITPIGRLTLGGSKSLLVGGVDNQKVPIFSVTFAASDHKFVTGVVHLSVVAKQVAGSVQIQTYRKSIIFIAGHNGSANAGNARWGLEYGAENVTSFGGITFLFECNTTAYPTFASFADVFTFYLTANSDLTTISEMTIHYNIEYNGEIDIVLL